MTVYVWTDHRASKGARAVVQQGSCGDGHCGQFSISISNGEIGMTVRFDSEAEFCRFLEHGEAIGTTPVGRYG
jgi:hypothetical protein